jgi:hypothetical protein
MTRALERRRYLGDGVYVAYDGYRIVLSVENGVVSREIVLEPDVWAALAAWVVALARDEEAR